MNGTYDASLVALSVAVAVMASYVALDLASHVTASTGRTARRWLLGGALSMGMGIWSMHFIGMLAFDLGTMPMSYDVATTLASLLVAVFVSGFALRTVSGTTLGVPQLLTGGALMGVGIASMHYVGMAAMRVTPPIRYDPLLFALSILIAIVVSLAALWIAFRLREETILSAFWRKAGGALLMGIAICGMHYTGMAAAIFAPGTMATGSGYGISNGWMAATIASFSFVQLGTTLLVSVFDTRRLRDAHEHASRTQALRASHDELEVRVVVRTAELARINNALQAEIAERERTEQALRAREDEAREILDTAYDAYVGMSGDGRILEWNRQAERTFGWAAEEAVGRDFAETLLPERYRAAHAGGVAHFLASGEDPVLNRRTEISAVHRDGREFPVELTVWPVRIGSGWKFNAFLHDISDRQKAVRRLAAQTAAAAALVESTTLDEAARKVLQAICNALGWAVGALWMVDHGKGALRCAHVWHQPSASIDAFELASRNTALSAGVGVPGRVWQEGKPVWVADIGSEAGFPRREFAVQAGLHETFGFPVVSSGKVLGVVEFLSWQIQEPDDDLLRMMDTIGTLLGQFIDNRTAETALEDERQFLAVLLENLSDGIVACDEHGTLNLFNRATREFHGLPEEPLPPVQWSRHYDLYLADGTTPMPTEQIPLFRAFSGEAVRNVEIVVAPRGRPQRTLVCNGQPLLTASGRKLGAVVALHDITERKQAEQRLQQLAHFDPLTALPNRVLFYQSLRDAIGQATEQGWIVAVLFLDLDHFKNINDTLGHACGDELLRQVGRRLVHTLRLRDTVGRLGGDEFAIILCSPDSPQSAAVVAEKLREALRKPFDLDGREVAVTASIGVTVFPGDAAEAEALIKYADTAMYAAKEAGRDTFRFYTADMNAHVVRRLDLENALRKALDRDEFVMHYQPKIDIASGRWNGVEALLRWNRPAHGMVPPGEFVPLLEETGLIESVGIWVIDKACRQIKAWIADGVGPVPVAVNVSVKQLLRGRLEHDVSIGTTDHVVLVESPTLEPAVERALRENDVPAHLLEIELTESTLMLHAAKTVGLLQRLRSLGIRISIDDFGTGYSSLAYLKRFPIQTVKIDQAFIRDITTDPDDAAIAVAIVSLAHSLKLKVVAEGVETPAQLAFLRDHGCDQAQGYLIARPLQADAVAALFRDSGGVFAPPA